MSHLRPLTVLAAIVLAAPASARMPDDVVAQYRVLEQLLNRPHGSYATMFSAASDCAYRHTYRKTITPQMFIDRHAVIDFADLDLSRHRIEDRDPEPVRMMIVPLRAGAADVQHSLHLVAEAPEMQADFLQRYGGRCGKSDCRATRPDREVFITVVGESAETDIETVANAVTDLATYCADAKGG